jgi:hypothetical protein
VVEETMKKSLNISVGGDAGTPKLNLLRNFFLFYIFSPSTHPPQIKRITWQAWWCMPYSKVIDSINQVRN